MAHISIEIAGLEVAFEELVERLRRLEAKVDALSADRGWYSTVTAAEYLSTTPVAIRSLVQSGKLEASRSGAGNLTITQAELDRFAQARNGRP